MDGRQYAQAAREYAVAYLFESRPEVLLEVARACRKAEMDLAAQAIFVRVREQLPRPVIRYEIDEELKKLNYSLESDEVDLSQILRSQMNLGKQAFQEGRFASAIVEYALAYSIKRLPRLMFNTAQSYRRDNDAEEAYLLYVAFLNEEPDAPIRTEVLGYLKELRAAAFPPPLHRRPLFWVPFATSVVAVVAIGLGLGYGIPRSQQPSKPMIVFDFP